MNKLKFIGLLLVGSALVFTGCDALQANLTSTKQAAIQADKDAVAEIAKIDIVSLTKITDGSYLGVDSPATYSTTIDQTAGTATCKLLDIPATTSDDWGNKANAFSKVTLDITTVNGGKTNYIADSVVNLDTGNVTVIVTSVDRKHTKTYTVQLAALAFPTQMLLVGTSADSNATWSDHKFALVNDSSATFSGVTYLKVGEFKFKELDDWSGINVGNGGDFSDTDDTTFDLSTLSGAGNFKIATAGFYILQVDFANSKVNVVPVTKIAAVGAGTTAGWPGATTVDALVLTGDTSTDIFTLTTTLTAAEWKLRCNDAWSWNFGDNGADGIADFNGANITGPAGSHTITFNGRTFALTTP